MVASLSKSVQMVQNWLKMSGRTTPFQNNLDYAGFQIFSLVFARVLSCTLTHLRCKGWLRIVKKGPGPLKIGPNGPIWLKMTIRLGPFQNTLVFATFQIFWLVCARFLRKVFANHNPNIAHFTLQIVEKNCPRHLKIGPNGTKITENVGRDRTITKHFSLSHFSNFSIGLCKVFANHNPNKSHLRVKGLLYRLLKKWSQTSQNRSKWSKNGSKCQEGPDQFKTVWFVPLFNFFNWFAQGFCQPHTSHFRAKE